MFRQLLVAFMSIVISHSALSHGSHGSITEEKALSIATEVVNGFAGTDPQLGFGVVAKSWAGVRVDAASIHKRGQGYYIIKILNAQAGSPLYLLMDAGGEVYDANLIGEFSGVK
jgi:hypothetical protein